MYSTKIKNRIKGALCPGARTGRWFKKSLHSSAHGERSPFTVRLNNGAEIFNVYCSFLNAAKHNMFCD